METKEIQEAKSKDIFNVISAYTELKKIGRRFVGLCPFHNENSPSFFVEVEKNNFRCYGCGVGGDVIQFIRLAEKMTFPQAVNFLNNNKYKKVVIKKPKQDNTPKRVDYIANNIAERYFTQYSKNNFLVYLNNRIKDIDVLTEIVNRFSIGTDKNGETMFFQRDIKGNFRTAQIIQYDPNTGKRLRDYPPKWLHKTLKINDFSLGQCFFGEWQLSFEREKDKTIAIVEAPKTAALMSSITQKFTWLACGGAEGLNYEKFYVLSKLKRKVILFPDFGQLERWEVLADTIRKKYNLNISVSEYLENHVLSMSPEMQEQYKGCDLADFNFE